MSLSTDTGAESAQPSAHPYRGLRKHERLHHEVAINRLFADGKKLFAFPLRAVYTIAPVAHTSAEHGARLTGGIRVLIIAQKRLFKRATARNCVRRQIRESLRIRIGALREQLREKDLLLTIAFIAIDVKAMDHARCGKAMARILGQLSSGMPAECAAFSQVPSTANNTHCNK